MMLVSMYVCTHQCGARPAGTAGGGYRTVETGVGAAEDSSSRTRSAEIARGRCAGCAMYVHTAAQTCNSPSVCWPAQDIGRTNPLMKKPLSYVVEWVRVMCMHKSRSGAYCQLYT